MSTAKVTLFQDGIRTHVSINLPRKPRGIAPDRSATWTHLSHLQLGAAAPPENPDLECGPLEGATQASYVQQERECHKIWIFTIQHRGITITAFELQNTLITQYLSD